MFVLSISAWFLLRGRNVAFAKRSMTVAASFGLASALSVVVLGDESGYALSDNQRMKLAAMEAMWETEPPPASFTVFGWPDVEQRKTHYAIHIPWVMGIIATRSIDKPILGINDLETSAEKHIRRGLIAYDALQKLQANPKDAAAKQVLDHNVDALGYGLLLKRWMDDPLKATDADIKRAATSTIPNVPVLFWSFRVMVACGFYFIALFALAFWYSARRELDKRAWFLKLALYSLPLPWIAAELGWIVAEYGRQPWAIDGVLPTALGVSSVSAAQVATSLAGFVVFYTALLVVDIVLMKKYIRLGPDGLGMWRSEPVTPPYPASAD
jgi:cytochrome d ubiquinol oxidase subunit I